MSSSRAYVNKNNFRELFLPGGEKEEISPSLQRALALLQVHNLKGLEERFLSTEAFLKPWAEFRDSIFVSQPAALSRATTISSAEVEDGIRRLDVLWFYTQFDEGKLRYDPRADQNAPEYIPEDSVYGVINKRNWGVVDHEKLLFVWLLQEFKVGKVINPWGFAYFEGKNICSAWEEVFVPIIDAVRASYSVKGRKNYGRLALMIEKMSPSRLAFPEGNVNLPQGPLSSPTPVRLVSIPKKQVPQNGSKFYEHIHDHVGLTKKHYDETEKELRVVYPQYGGLVERPKPKHKIEEWLLEQRRRADWKKDNQAAGYAKAAKGWVDRDDEQHIQDRIRNLNLASEEQTAHGGNVSPIKQYTDNLRRSLSTTFSKKSPKEEHKNQLRVVNHDEYDHDEMPKQASSPVRKQLFNSGPLSKLGGTSSTSPFLEQMHHQGYENRRQQRNSEQIVYETIRKSNPFSRDSLEDPKTFQQYTATHDLPFSPMSQPENVPSPLRFKPKYSHAKTLSEESLVLSTQKYDVSVRSPSYEGSGYANEISLSTLQKACKDKNSSSGTIGFWENLGRYPSSSVHPAMRTGPAYATPMNESRDSLPKAVPWPGNESDDSLSSPFAYDEDPRYSAPSNAHVGHPRFSQTVRAVPRDLAHIVSKENIRAALRGSSQESLEEEAVPPMPKLSQSGASKMSAHPNYKDGKLQTYNTHMFPRKTPASKTAASAKKTQYEVEEEYEMEILGGKGKKHRT